VALARVTVAPVSTGTSPGRGGHTSGSLSIQHSGRGAAAGVRAGPRAAAGRGRWQARQPPRPNWPSRIGQILAAGQPTGSITVARWPGAAGPGGCDPVPVKPPDRWSGLGWPQLPPALPAVQFTGRAPVSCTDIGASLDALAARVCPAARGLGGTAQHRDPDLPPDVIVVRDGSSSGSWPATVRAFTPRRPPGGPSLPNGM